MTVNTGLAATIAEIEAEISTLINAAGDLHEDAREIEEEEPFAEKVDARLGRIHLAEIGRELKAIEDSLLSLYGTLSLLQAEQSILARHQSTRLAFA